MILTIGLSALFLLLALRIAYVQGWNRSQQDVIKAFEDAVGRAQELRDPTSPKLRPRGPRKTRIY